MLILYENRQNSAKRIDREIIIDAVLCTSFGLRSNPRSFSFAFHPQVLSVILDTFREIMSSRNRKSS